MVYRTDAVWRAKLQSIAGSPDSFTMMQNYPNPFNRSTLLFYQVPQTSKIRLVIYNTRGQEVVQLVDGVQHAGYYRQPLDAAQMPSGIYWAVLYYPGGRQTVKMLVMH
jgi:hypothetical protein